MIGLHRLSLNNKKMKQIYRQLKECIYSISIEMFPQICGDMDKIEDKRYNYYFILVNEIYKGLALCCTAIDIQAYFQIGTLLRQLFEQVATAKVIGEDENALSAYRTFAKARQYYLVNGKDETQLNALLAQSKIAKKKLKKPDYFSIGWLELIGESDVTYEKLFDRAQISDLINWRKYCNNYVHTNITFMEYTQEDMIKQSNDFIYLMAILLDVICCSYHNVTKYDFNNHQENGFVGFRKIYSQITKTRTDY